MLGEEILTEIDTTLDQLIRNAEAIQKVEVEDLSEMEIQAFKNTQESLIQHLLHMDEFLEIKRKSLSLQEKRSASFKIQEKLLQFEKMKSVYHKKLDHSQQKRSFLLKRRRKKLLSFRNC